MTGATKRRIMRIMRIMRIRLRETPRWWRVIILGGATLLATSTLASCASTGGERRASEQRATIAVALDCLERAARTLSPTAAAEFCKNLLHAAGYQYVAASGGYGGGWIHPQLGPLPASAGRVSGYSPPGSWGRRW